MVPHVLLGATAVAAGVFVGLAVRAKNREDIFVDSPCEPVQCRVLYDDLQDASRDADIVLGVAGALALTTFVFYLLNRPRPGAARGVIQLSASPQEGLVGVQGTF